MSKIAILCSPHHQSVFSPVIQEHNLADRFVFWVYQDFSAIDGLYQEGCSHVEGILCTGDVPYKYMQINYPDCKVPITHVENNSLLNACLRLLRHVCECPHIPMNELYCDFLGDLQTYTLFSQVIPAEKLPYTVLISSISPNLFAQLAADVTKLYEEGKIKKAFLTLTSLYHLLKEAGIPCELIPIAPENILTGLYNIIDKVDGAHARQAVMTVTMIDFIHGNSISEDPEETEYREITLLKALVDYKRRPALERSMTIMRDGAAIEIIAPAPKDGDPLQPMLDLMRYLKKEYPYSATIGIGIGPDMRISKESAESALNYAKGFGNGSIFSMHRQQLSGPLLSPHSLSLDTTLIASTTKIARRLGINNLNYLRLLSLFQMEQIITAEQAAKYLNIAHRSAHRILLLLLEDGVVCEMPMKAEDRSNRKGRPAKYFALSNTTSGYMKRP